MSTPLEDPIDGPSPDDARRSNRFALAMRVVAALSALVSLLVLWLVERAQLRHDLQLAADSDARPGELIALRALLFRDVEAPEGPTLARAPVRVRLLDPSDRELAREQLAPTALDTMDGAMQLPAGRTGRFTLEARSRYAGNELVSRRALRIEPDAPAAVLHGREAGPLQQFALGRVRASGAEPVPDPLLVRVLGGACVPERRCRLLAWVGEPAAAVSLRASPAATLAAGPAPDGETNGLVAFEVVVHGLDAQVTLQARRGGELVAERALRLPVALGEVGIAADASVVDRAAAELRLAPPPGRPHVIVDLFASGRWRATQAVAAGGGEAGVRLPEGRLAPGLLRVQARVDRFSAEGSGARVLYVRSPGERDLMVLAEIARRVAEEPALQREPTEPTTAWRHGLPAFALEDVQRTAAFLLAPLEQLRSPVPPPVSGRPAQLARLARTRMALRFGVAGALVLSSLVIALSIARRGLSAADQAHGILVEARGSAREQGEVEARGSAREQGEVEARGSAREQGDSEARSPARAQREGEARGFARTDLGGNERARATRVQRAKTGDPARSAGAEDEARELLRARMRVLLFALAVATAFLAAALLIAAKPLWF